MRIKVMHQNNTIGEVEPSLLDTLIHAKEVKGVLHSYGWAMVDSEIVRGRGGRYEGPDRRVTDRTILARASQKWREPAYADPYHGHAVSILETLQEPIAVLDSDLKVLMVNKSFYFFFKVPADDILGRFLYDVGSRQWDIPELLKSLKDVVKFNTHVRDYEIECAFPRIGYKTILINARRIQQDEFKTRMILMSLEDISERKEKEKELAQLEERYRRFFENAQDGMLLLNRQTGCIVNVNQSMALLLGYSRVELIGKKIDDIGIFNNITSFHDAVHQLGWIGHIDYNDVTIRTKEGRYIDTKVRLTDKSKFIQCSIQDLTQHRQIEEELWTAGQKYLLLFEKMLQGVVCQDSYGKVISINPAAEKILGRSRTEVMTQAYSDDKHPALRADGSPFPSLEHPSTVALLTGREVKDVVMGVFNPVESAYHWINVTAVPLFKQEEDTPSHVYLLFNDVTDSRR